MQLYLFLEFSRMPYHSNATPYLSIDHDSIADWKSALSGQWFIGVVDTEKRSVKLAPVNIFDARGNLDSAVLNNTSMQGMNRYASGAAGERVGDSAMPEYLLNRAAGMTHHTAVVKQAGFDPSSSLGFSLIKINCHFAQMKMASNSLNADKPGARYHHSFSRAISMKRDGYFPGSAQLPLQWQHALTLFFNTTMNIPHVSVSND
ncbi:hypothetical protein CS533_14300 [Yersinia bercovieri]|uniref:Uncharacterized protein n=1 Tax=Yersinia bercovieri TaxID=634 RepID=A0A2G4U0C4_YERBE|nr:hypothetical protein [Yersinia bercovieri]PHZ26758.1 hypothetical protein CS533_14300 [Yersinia bercovieri]